MAKARVCWMKAVTAVAVAAGISACASTPRSDVARGLMAIGFDKRPAQCIAREMDEQLPPGQMRAVADVVRQAAKAERGNRSPLSALEAALALDDPQLGKTVLMAGAGCMLVNAR